MLEQSNGGFLISKIKQVQGRVFAKLLIEFGIDQFNGAQGRILFVLWKSDNIAISELAEKTGLAKTTLTSMLDRLEKAGYLVRIFEPHDRRKVYIRLTEASRQLEKQYNAVSKAMNTIFYAGFTDAEVRDLEDKLQLVLINLTRKESLYE